MSSLYCQPCYSCCCGIWSKSLLHRVLNVAFCQKTLKRYRALKKGSWCLSVSVTYVPLDWWGVGTYCCHIALYKWIDGWENRQEKSDRILSHLGSVKCKLKRQQHLCEHDGSLSWPQAACRTMGPFLFWSHISISILLIIFYVDLLSWELISVWEGVYFCMLVYSKAVVMEIWTYLP